MTTHTFHQISPHVYWLSPDHTTDRPLLGVVAGTHGSLIIDAGNSPAHLHQLLQAMTEQGLPPPIYAMLTHWHWDHVFGTSALTVPTFASRETARIVRILAELDWGDAALEERVAAGTEIAFCRDMIKAELPDRTDLSLRPPDIAFDTAVTIDLGGVSCELVHVGGDHAHDASIVYVPEEKILFLGDCLYDDLYHGPRRLTTTQLFPLLDRLSAYDVDFYLASHDPEPLSHTRFAADATLFKAIGETVATTGLDRGAMLDQLPHVLPILLTDDHCEIVDAFLAGLRMPVVAPIW
jgi:glyoxylase-like metal-dependent hydrolase (beta-lactamase superfamily II)